MIDATEIQDGVMDALPNAVYHSRGMSAQFIGNSGLKAMARSPAYYYGNYLDPLKPPKEKKEPPSQLFGNIVHCALFEFPRLKSRYVVGPDVNKNTNAWKDFVKSLPQDSTPCDQEILDSALKARESALTIPDLREALLHPEAVGERSVFATDPTTGIRTKTRPDLVIPAGPDAVVIFDGKTYDSADPGEFGRQAARMDYHMQAPFYSDMYTAATGKKVLAFVFILVENVYPFVSSCVMLDEDAIDAGRRKYQRLLRTYKQCRDTGVWPAFGEAIRPVSLPKYALEQSE